ncbi:MAG: lipoyl(octanoyl) transferase LipB [Deltaproteobacteria bacterium]|nr:lipoyl(octanoyl) transferase LipB [Deltaproteobacteria bacterium]MBI2363892.1 lipoyl(octanoyl) transferase LipB [Deltaproteobacteria bacterium]MBI2531724.1 lipoyl(octanoyl) transferase LipB [Deltaproteobacteria bacterium]MBI3065103.1 lipoyl(octanoyl) transferase LipB [Deltaproteobacteria bacterium]
MAELVYKDLGRLDYLAALALQENLVALKQREDSPDILLFVEHPHVYTLGRGGQASNVLAPEDVPVYRTSRGGDVTYHGPGQLVVYPIIDLRSKLRKDVHRYLRNLETSAIRTLADFGLEGTRRPPFTGIWIGDRKIAAIGVAVRRCITYHGLALNVNTDLSYFKRIVPCGLAWADVTSMAEELGTELDQREVRDRFLHHFAEVFDYGDLRESPIAEDGGWRVEDGHPRSSIINPRYA